MILFYYLPSYILPYDDISPRGFWWAIETYAWTMAVLCQIKPENQAETGGIFRDSLNKRVGKQSGLKKAHMDRLKNKFKPKPHSTPILLQPNLKRKRSGKQARFRELKKWLKLRAVMWKMSWISRNGINWCHRPIRIRRSFNKKKKLVEECSN